MWDHLGQAISDALGHPFTISSHHSINGGDINDAWQISDGKSDYFLKTNDPSKSDMFAAEADGLRTLAAANAIRVPQPVCYGVYQSQSYLVMEYLPLNGHLDGSQFGQQMAELHQYTQENFGWHRDNTIGSTQQKNELTPGWVAFWKTQRLGFQLQLALKNGASSRLANKGEQLLADLDAFFTSYSPQASVLHGDLWSGNWGADHQGNPVIFDPAVYFGDHEADLAMMELFGHPGNAFFSAYGEIFPIDPGYPVRKTLYNLYHILNHYNLFRGGYAGQAERMIERLISEIS